MEEAKERRLIVYAVCVSAIFFALLGPITGNAQVFMDPNDGKTVDIREHVRWPDVVSAFEYEEKGVLADPDFYKGYSVEASAEKACDRHFGFKSPAHLKACQEALEPLLEPAREKRRAVIAERTAAKQRDELAIDQIGEPYARSGDFDQMARACMNYKFERLRSEDCGKGAYLHRAKALQTKQVQPNGCREYGIYHQILPIGNDPMTIGLVPAREPGFFSGKVIDITDRQLVIHNDLAAQSAVVILGKAKLYGAQNIVVGGGIVGYGVQTSRRQAKLINGATRTIPVISAVCAGDS